MVMCAEFFTLLLWVICIRVTTGTQRAWVQTNGFHLHTASLKSVKFIYKQFHLDLVKFNWVFIIDVRANHSTGTLWVHITHRVRFLTTTIIHGFSPLMFVRNLLVYLCTQKFSNTKNRCICRSVKLGEIYLT